MAKKKMVHFTVQEVIQKLEDTLDEYISSDEMYYPMILAQQHDIYPTRLTYWRQNYPDEILPLINELDAIRDMKVRSALLNGHGNATSLIWYTKCNDKWIPAEVTAKLDSEKEIASSNTPIMIGFKSESNDKQ